MDEISLFVSLFLPLFHSCESTLTSGTPWIDLKSNQLFLWYTDARHFAHEQIVFCRRKALKHPAIEP